MRIRLLVSQEERKKLQKELENKGFDIDDRNYDYTIVSNSPVDKIIVFGDEELFIINPNDVIYFESFGNDIVCHTIRGDYKVKYRLYELEHLFNEKGYMRVSNSFIVNVNHISSIKPTINSKFILTMNNRDKVEVTRSYYIMFKRFIEGGM